MARVKTRAKKPARRAKQAAVTASERTTPHFSDLPSDEQKRITRSIFSNLRRHGYFGAGRYNIVQSSEDTALRRAAGIELDGEDYILKPHSRAKFINLARDGVRNSETLNALLKQFQLNVIGTVGGKASFGLPEQETSNMLREEFAKYCTSCEFFDGLSFSRVLGLVLKTLLIGGDLVLLFDSGEIEGSGKILAFEPDCIANIRDEDFAAMFPAGWTQRNGRIYNANSRFVGVIVSESQRGEDVFDADGCFFLTKDADQSPLDCGWTMLRNVWRFNQGRGTSPLSAPLASIIDLEDVTKYEVQTAKKNSQTLAQVISSGDNGGGLPPDLDPANMPSEVLNEQSSEEAIAAATEDETDDYDDYVTLDKITAAGAVYEVMPDNSRLELLDTKHPNPNMPEFIRWLAGRSAASLGLGSVYATLKADASYTAFRGEQVMSWPAFEEAQKYLENGVCDWLVRRWMSWAMTRGIIPANIKLPKAWERMVSWIWPKMREVNQIDEQNALALKLKNGTGTYAEHYGPDWRERLAQVAAEVAYCKQLGLPHPALQTVSGSMIDMPGKAGKEGATE